MRLPNKKLERRLFQRGYKNVVAIDEVGVGPLAGPVVACAVSFNKNFYKKYHKKLSRLRDSKLVPVREREELARELLRIRYIKYKISYSYPRTIDRLNIYQAARSAMRRAANGVVGIKYQDTIVLVDGPHKISGLGIDQIPITKGDRKVFSIACASIIAKVFRDRMMARYARKFPNYGFEKHKGYGTKLHIAQLASFGPCEIHRKSFNPVAKLI